eukprot:681315-Alexandrium_andersonii.AAC.1
MQWPGRPAERTDPLNRGSFRPARNCLLVGTEPFALMISTARHSEVPRSNTQTSSCQSAPGRGTALGGK